MCVCVGGGEGDETVCVFVCIESECNNLQHEN